MQTEQTAQWIHQRFGSGTQIVRQQAAPDAPYLYIYGPRLPDDGERDGTRSGVCKEVAAYLNGEGSRPAWLDDLVRTSETCLVGHDGTSILAVGPMVSPDPGACNWIECDHWRSQNARARLIDRLTLTGGSS